MPPADSSLAPSTAEPRAPAPASVTGATSRQLFREQALAHARLTSFDADVLRISPRWTERAYRVLVAAFVVAVAYGLVAHVFAYASGPAIVWRSEERRV